MAKNLLMDKVVTKFEKKISEFYGSKYAVATDSCTHAIELCLIYKEVKKITIPTRTYISIPFLAKKLNLKLEWSTKKWSDYYFIENTNIIDAAVFWKEKSYIPGTFMCLSFQFQKHLSLGRGGMILLDDEKAAADLKKLSYDGREPNQPWREQNIKSMGYHYYMTPETAGEGLKKISEAKKNIPRVWEWNDWPDLRSMDVFK